MPLLPPRSALATGRRVRHAHVLAHARRLNPPCSVASAPSTLSVDIGGTGIKMITLDAAGEPISSRTRFLTPNPATPQAVLEVIQQMFATQPQFSRVAVGFPGVVVDGVVYTAANLGNEIWQGFPIQEELAKLCGVAVRVMNDADLQGYGVIERHGVELVLTLGTGLGTALFVNGHLVPNLELGHHPFKKGKTYEERTSDAECRRLGKKEWSGRVKEMLEQIQPIFNPNLIHLGGGNVEHLRLELPENVRTFTNVDGMTGGVFIWDDH